VTRNVLSVALDPDRNSYNAVRLVAAIAVLISHGFAFVGGSSAAEPLGSATSFTLGQHAVNVFFVISGLTLSQSLAHRPDLVRYGVARALRIFPALFVYGFLCAFVVGPLLTVLSLTDYFGDAHTWLYPFAVLVQFANAVPPHGIFSQPPFPEAANEPLWTIKYEIAAYIGLAMLMCVGALQRRWPTVACLILSCGAFVLLHQERESLIYSFPYQSSRYAVCFLLGVLAYSFRERLNVSPTWLTLTAFGGWLFVNSRLEPLGWIFLAAHLSIVAGAADYGVVSRFCRRIDLSYGAYIYGWPVQKILLLLFPVMGVTGLISVSLICVLLFATASWVFIEEPALALKRRDPRLLFRASQS
jgi:peptidoglycan/LPS O-acetylase OafA/YrhL